MKKHTLYAAVLMMALFACKKKDDANGPFPTTSYTFTNKTDKPINIRVFVDSGYYQEGGRCVYLNAMPGQQVVMPYNKLNENGDAIPPRFAYYWSSIDNILSSWGKDFDNYPRFAYNKAVQGYNMDILPNDGATDAAYALNGIDGKTMWKAVDAFDSTGNSVWASLPDTQKRYMVSLHWSKHIWLRRMNNATDMRDSIYLPFTTSHSSPFVLNAPQVLAPALGITDVKLRQTVSSLSVLTGYNKLYMILNNARPTC
jgi:hypothetical protein